MKNISKVWGHEQVIVNSDYYCGKILHLKKQYRCSIHFHRNKIETFYVLDGRVLMEFGKHKKLMNKGSVITINQNMRHRFTGLKDSRIIEFSSHDNVSDSHRETRSEKIKKPEFNKLYRRYQLKGK